MRCIGVSFTFTPFGSSILKPNLIDIIVIVSFSSATFIPVLGLQLDYNVRLTVLEHKHPDSVFFEKLVPFLPVVVK